MGQTLINRPIAVRVSEGNGKLCCVRVSSGCLGAAAEENWGRREVGSFREREKGRRAACVGRAQAGRRCSQASKGWGWAKMREGCQRASSHAYAAVWRKRGGRGCSGMGCGKPRNRLQKGRGRAQGRPPAPTPGQAGPRRLRACKTGSACEPAQRLQHHAASETPLSSKHARVRVRSAVALTRLPPPAPRRALPGIL